MYTGKSLKNLETLEEIREILQTVTFPCSRDDVLKCAKDARAPRRIMKILEMLLDSVEKFQNIDEVISYFADKLEIYEN